MLLFLRFLRFLIVSASLISAFKFVQISSTIKNNNNLVGNNNNRLNSQSSALKLALNTSIQKKLLWLPNLILNLFKFTKKSLTGQKLRDGIAKFYDESSQIWLDVWGEHMHHGYYEQKNPTTDHKQAQIEMIDRAVNWSYGADLATANPTSTVDVGCGVGGSSRHIVKRFNMKEGRGLSLSPFQIKKANEFTASAGLADRVQYTVDDALSMPFSNGKFDLTWSMESGEHMPDKEMFMNELVRVTAPGGRIILVTWCHRELLKDEAELKPFEQRLLQKINEVYFLPDWCPVSRYVQLAKKMGLEDVRTEDWSDYVAPFWPAVMASALVPRNFFRMLQSGWTTIKGAIASLWMLRGYQKGVVKFVILTGRKPTAVPRQEPPPPLPVEHWGTEE